MKVNLYAFLVLVFGCSLLSYGQSGKANQFAPSSVLADGNWYKIATTTDGVYKLTYQNLIDLGLPQPIKSSDFRLYGNGGAMLPEANAAFRYDDLIENAVFINDQGDGYLNPGDYILFYGQSPTKWNYNQTDSTFKHIKNLYSDTTYYFVTMKSGSPKRIAPYPVISSVPDITVNASDYYGAHELDSLNLINSGKQWVGEVFDQALTHNFTYVIPNVDKTRLMHAFSRTDPRRSLLVPARPVFSGP